MKQLLERKNLTKDFSYLKSLSCILLVLILLTWYSSILYGQSAGNITYNSAGYGKSPARINTNLKISNPNLTHLQAEILINVKATSYVAIFGVTQHGETASETDRMMAFRIKTFTDGLSLIGVKDEQIHLDAISFVPTYTMKIVEKKFSKTANEIPTGFQMKKNIHVIFKRHEMLDYIISQAAKSEIYDLIKVEYNCADINLIYESLVVEAAAIIKNKEQLYTKMGLHLEVKNLAEDIKAVYPIERYKSFTAFFTGNSYEEIKRAKAKLMKDYYTRNNKHVNINVSGNNSRVSINSKDIRSMVKQTPVKDLIINTANKNKSIFYDRIPYNQFNHVMNADAGEPSIQFYYSLKVQYSVTNLKKYEKSLEARTNKIRKNKS